MQKIIIMALFPVLSSPVMAVSSSLDGAGPLNGIEWQVDMPWRMEPVVVTGKNNLNANVSKDNKIGKRQFFLSDAIKIGVPQEYELYPGDDHYQVTQYDPIPITFTMHDVGQQEGFQENGERILLNRFCGMYVIEFQPGKTEPETEVTFIPSNEFYEIEASKGWGTNSTYIPENHQIRRLWDDESANDLLNMSDWREWHGTAYYTPVSGTPKGKDLRIIAAARVSMGSDCSDQYYSAADIVNQLRRNNQFHPAFEAVNSIINELKVLKDKDKSYSNELLNAHIDKLKALDVEDLDALKALYYIRSSNIRGDIHWIYDYFLDRNNPNNLGNLIFVGTEKLNQEDSLFFGDFLRTHYAADPLPDFGNEWAYGDLHYHSQGTDNEGESGTSYRSALASMKAMGLDYAFATDHASNADQLTGIKSAEVKYNSPWYIPDFIAGWALDKINSVIGGLPFPQHEALRDMSPERFDHLLHWLQGDSGGNEEVVYRPGSNRSPQIFLGGEVDVIPEVSIKDAEQGSYRYGDGKFYNWLLACGDGLPQEITDYTAFPEFCVQSGLQKPYKDGRVMLTDVQGLLETDHFARQHLLYLPYQVDPSEDNTDIFVSSNSSVYGGASRNFDTVLDELESKDLGFMFLAHPVSAASGNGIGRLGPDIYPYSEAQLEVAFASPRVIGLQIWNENARFHSADRYENSKFPFLHGTRLNENENGNIDWSQLDWRWEKMNSKSLANSLHHGSAMWDMVNLWGITPKRTQAIELPNGTPRKFFMAGGSDAHGDMNYRREGQLFGWSGANDTALGTPRNLTFIGSDQENNINGNAVISQDQVIDGLRSGRFSVTDGPAFRIAIDTNNNGEIDNQDILMGEDATMATVQGITFPQSQLLGLSSKINVIVEWKSTPEWGPVDNIKLFVGVQSDSHQGLVYNYGRLCGAKGIKDSLGREYCPAFSEIYVWDTSGQLNFNVPPSEGFGGKHTMQVDALDYKLFDKECKNPEVAATKSIQNRKIIAPDHGIQKPFGDLVVVIPEPLPEPTAPVCTAVNVKDPERMFIRAVATTIDNTNPPIVEISEPVRRFAFSNPVWVRDIPKANQLTPNQFVKLSPNSVQKL